MNISYKLLFNVLEVNNILTDLDSIFILSACSQMQSTQVLLTSESGDILAENRKAVIEELYGEKGDCSAKVRTQENSIQTITSLCQSLSQA